MTISRSYGKWLKIFGQPAGVMPDHAAAARQIEWAPHEWETAINAVQEPIFIHDAEMRIVRANRAYTAHAGFDICEVIGKPYWKVFPKLDGPLPGCLESLKERKDGNVEEVLHLDSGEEYISRTYPIYSGAGKYLYSMHVMQGVGEQRRAETENQTLSEALRQAAEAVLVLDADARITYLNPAFYRLFGYAPDDVIGQPIAALRVPDQEANLQPSDVIRQLNENGTCHAEAWRRAKDGTAIPVMLSTAAIRDARGGIAGYVGTYLDLRPAKQAEQAQRESERRLKVITESVPAGIVMIDPEKHKIVDVNTVAANMIGEPKDKIIGAECHKFICPAEKGKCPITNLHQTVDHSDRVLLTAAGKARPIIKNVSTVILSGKEYILESFIDITELKHMESSLKETIAEKAALVQKLNDLATHDDLTGLYNHRTFYTLLADELVRAQRFNRPTSLLMLDIDHFKRVNDTHGHQAGDAILKGLGELLNRRRRAVDRVSRYGGEEITIILPETDLEAAVVIAERLRAAVESELFNVSSGTSIGITVSTGVASWPVQADDAQTLVAAADAAMYVAKQNGRNLVVKWTPSVGIRVPPETS